MDIKRQQFLEELTELSKKYNLYIHGCGCCDSPFIMNGEPHWTNGEIGWNKKAGRYIDWGDRNENKKNK